MIVISIQRETFNQMVTNISSGGLIWSHLINFKIRQSTYFTVRWRKKLLVVLGASKSNFHGFQGLRLSYLLFPRAA